MVVTLGNNKLIYLAANSTRKKPYLLGFLEEPYAPFCHHFHVSCVQINGVPEISLVYSEEIFAIKE